MLLMHGVAWLLNDLVFNDFWAGFFVEAGLFLLIGRRRPVRLALVKRGSAADPGYGDGGQGDQGSLRRRKRTGGGP